MTYPTMPRPSDNTGDNHRAAIAALEKAVENTTTRHAEVKTTRDNAQRVVTQALADMAELEAQAASLRRGIDALKAADQ